MMNHRVRLLACLLLLGVAASAPAGAQIFGPSDEEKAHEAGQDSKLSDLAAQNQQLAVRLQALEDKTRSLTDSLSQATGTNEELRHQVDLLSQKLDQSQKDFSYRLCMVTAQQLGAGQGDSGLNCAGGGTANGFAPAQPQGLAPGTPLPPLGGGPMAGGQMGAAPMGGDPAMMPSGAPQQLVPQQIAPQQLGRPPGNLGTLSSGDSGQIALRPAGGNQFDAAMNLLAKAQYDEAKASFRAYADANPDDQELAPQAIYWVGNIDYIQHNYPEAMTAFAEQIKKYPRSVRGPDSMMKLGQSLLAMGRTQEGCTTLGAIKSKFPDAPPATLTLAAGTRKASCH
jgi:tol-pal system protein YbgF